MKKQDLVDMMDFKRPSDIEKEKAQAAIERMRILSGSISDSDPVVVLLYHLLRDHLSSGVVEKLVQTVEESKGNEVLFTNGWLALYAQDLRSRMVCGK